jgi:group I intron endonuclease
MYSIYKITNKVNNRLYIGYSKRPAARWYDHKLYAANNRKGVLYDAMRKHGVENFVFEIIYQSLDMNHTKNIMEDFFITEYNSRTPNGYNNAPGGQGGALNIGFKHSENTKKKISIARKGKKMSDQTKQKISLKLSGCNNYMYGKHHTDQTKKILSEKAKTRTYDPTCRSYIKGPNNPTSKTYVVKIPGGDHKQVVNLKYFCCYNNLNESEMRKTLRGKAKQHKGYCVVAVL